MHADSGPVRIRVALTVPRSERSDMTEVFVEATSLDGRRWRSGVHLVTWSERPWDGEEAAPTCIGSPPATPRSSGASQRIAQPSSCSPMTSGLRAPSCGSPTCFVMSLRAAVRAAWSLRFDDGPLRPVLEAMGVDVHVTSRPLLGSAHSFEGWVHEMALLIRAHRAGAVLVNTLLLFPAVLAAQSADIPSLWAIHESIAPPTFFDHYGRSGLYGDMASDFHPIVRDLFEDELRLSLSSRLRGRTDRGLLPRHQGCHSHLRRRLRGRHGPHRCISDRGKQGRSACRRRLRRIGCRAPRRRSLRSPQVDRHARRRVRRAISGSRPPPPGAGRFFAEQICRRGGGDGAASRHVRSHPNRSGDHGHLSLLRDRRLSRQRLRPRIRPTLLHGGDGLRPADRRRRCVRRGGAAAGLRYGMAHEAS